MMVNYERKEITHGRRFHHSGSWQGQTQRQKVKRGYLIKLAPDVINKPAAEKPPAKPPENPGK
jgi:hypothetical protein